MFDELKAKLVDAGMLNNKYLDFYVGLCLKSRVFSPHDYTENHHIIPRSFGGSDDVCNLVRLSFREHFIAHRLLIRITKGHNKWKMQRAMFFMLGCGLHSGRDTGRLVTSRHFAIAKYEARSIQTSDETKLLQSKAKSAWWSLKSEEERLDLMAHTVTPMMNKVRQRSIQQFYASPDSAEERNSRSKRRIEFLSNEANLADLKAYVKKSWGNEDTRNKRIAGIKKACEGETFKQAQKDRWEKYWNDPDRALGNPNYAKRADQEKIHHSEKQPCKICGKKVKMMTRHYFLHHEGAYIEND